jgi:hypothetical protein
MTQVLVPVAPEISAIWGM